MNSKKILFILVILVCSVLALASCNKPKPEAGCNHVWQEATCETPKTCSLCSETEGEALGHSGGTATCTSKAVCDLCSAEYGDFDTTSHSTDETWFKKVDGHYKGYRCCGTAATELEAHVKVEGVCNVCGFDPAIVVSEAAFSEDGNTVILTVSVSDNPGIIGLQLEIAFDTNNLTLISAENGSLMAGLAFSAPDDVSAGGVFLWDAADMSDKDVTDGEILKLTFDVSEAIAGEYPVLVKVKDALDNDLAPLSFKVSNGTIKISD